MPGQWRRRRLPPSRDDQVARARLREHLADGRVGQRRDGVEAGVPGELLPGGDEDVGTHLMRDTGGGERLGEPACARALVPVGLAEEDLAPPAVEDRPRRGQLDADPREPDQERRQPEAFGEDAFVLDTVLQRQDRRLGRTTGRSAGTAARVSYDLTQTSTRSTPPASPGTRRHAPVRPESSATRRRAPHAALAAERSQVGAARDERDVVPAAGEQRPK
jgi:hypothetical protein